MHSVSMSDQQKVCVVEVVSIRAIACVRICVLMFMCACVCLKTFACRFTVGMQACLCTYFFIYM